MLSHTAAALGRRGAAVRRVGCCAGCLLPPPLAARPGWQQAAAGAARAASTTGQPRTRRQGSPAAPAADAQCPRPRRTEGAEPRPRAVPAAALRAAALALAAATAFAPSATRAAATVASAALAVSDDGARALHRPGRRCGGARVWAAAERGAVRRLAAARVEPRPLLHKARGALRGGKPGAVRADATCHLGGTAPRRRRAVATRVLPARSQHLRQALLRDRVRARAWRQGRVDGLALLHAAPATSATGRAQRTPGRVNAERASGASGLARGAGRAARARAARARPAARAAAQPFATPAAAAIQAAAAIAASAAEPAPSSAQPAAAVRAASATSASAAVRARLAAFCRRGLAGQPGGQGRRNTGTALWRNSPAFGAARARDRKRSKRGRARAGQRRWRGGRQGRRRQWRCPRVPRTAAAHLRAPRQVRSRADGRVGGGRGGRLLQRERAQLRRWESARLPGAQGARCVGQSGLAGRGRERSARVGRRGVLRVRRLLLATRGRGGGLSQLLPVQLCVDGCALLCAAAHAML